MIRHSRGALWALLPLFAACLVPLPAAAHAHLLQSSPPADATVTPPPGQLDLYFSEGIEPAFSGVEVKGDDGVRVDTGALDVAPGDGKHGIVKLRPLSPGRYHVAWHATATDTHRTQGNFDFSVGTITAPSALIVTQAWARPTIPTFTVGAAYLLLRNAGPKADKLVGVETPVADRAELHESETKGDTGTMKPLDSVDLPPGGSAAFAPLGKHIMLVGLHGPLALGTHFPMTLHFASGATVTVEVSVTRGAPTQENHDTPDMKGMKM
ncbi:MAG TPA: copper chaperone PCu(A)C [Stellaceae bacterium]|jgi:copper(I)-binding protein|nr:copper chaperone PCu(A)C [Stellaceae bacterium]